VIVPGRKRLLALAAVAAACYKSPRDLQRDYAQSLRPAPIGQSRATGPVRSLRVRVYADPEYQAQTPRWTDRIRAQIARADGAIEADFGVRLEVESIRTWKRAERFEGLEKALGDLATADPGADVDWVIGFAPALTFASAAHEQLGMAAVFGRHLVLRGMFSLEETRALETVLDQLPFEEREALLRERRLHKETAVLLHEWAHTLGAFHEHEPGSLMSPMYEPSQSGFSPPIVRLLRPALEQRNARDGEGLSRWAAAYGDEVRAATTIWDEATRAEALSMGERFFGSTAWPDRQQKDAARQPVGTEEAAPAAAGAGRLSVADAQRLEDAARKARARDLAGAAALLEPLRRRYPQDARLQGFSCSLAQAREPTSPGTLARCQAAARLPDAPVEIRLALAQVLLGRNDRAGAAATLARTESALRDASAPPQIWLALAQGYERAGTFSAAERAASRAGGQPGAKEIAAECARLRRLAALPKDAAVPPESERDYVDAVLQAQQDVRGGRIDRARAAAKDLAAKFPSAPGADVIHCLLHGRARAFAAAKPVCESAMRAAPEAFFPRYFLGLIAGAERRFRDAQTHLTRALELDDGTYEPWASLASVDQSLGETAALEELKARYRKRFGTELRPGLWPSAWTSGR
jgi:tetratricopeptide (TPR) repeat protein